MKFFLLALLLASAIADENQVKKEETEYFKHIDRNSDGKIDTAEFLTGIWAERSVNLFQFRQADENKDGKLAGSELEAVESHEENGTKRTFQVYGDMTGCLKNGEIVVRDYETAVKSTWARFSSEEFGQVDENKDGSLSVEEFMVVYRRLFAAAKERAFQTFNSNNDEGISSEEWFGMVWSGRFDAIAKRAAEFFTEADADGDNVLTLEEYMLHGKDSDKERFDQWVPTEETDRTRIPRETFLKHVDHEFHHTAKATFDLADKDKSGIVSKEEFTDSDNHGYRLDL